jgi:hypothetical protein
MTRFAALFAYCLCFATITMASNQDQWTGTTSPEKATVTLPKASYRNVPDSSQGDRRSNVMQTTKLRMFNGQSASLRKPTTPSPPRAQ